MRIATTGERSPHAGERLDALDGLRGLAAFAILALHAWLYTTPASGRREQLLDQVAHQLRLGVVLFFALSGWLLFRPWVRAVLERRPAPALGTYARRRFWRIAPGYWLCLAGALLLLAPLPGVPGVDMPPAALVPLFVVFAQNLHPATVSTLDPPMWTLGVEVSFYAALPALAWLGVRAGRAARTERGRRAALLLPAGVLLVGGTAFNAWLMQRDGSLVASSSLPAMGPCFAAGMAAAVAGHGRRLPRAAALALLAAGAALVVADGAWQEGGAGDAGRLLRDLPAAVGFAAVVAALASGALRARVLRSRALLGLGAISYGVYLWHMPLMLALRGVGLFPERSTFAALALTAAVTIPVAWLSWTLVERPLLARGRRPPRARRRERLRGELLHGLGDRLRVGEPHGAVVDRAPAQ